MSYQIVMTKVLAESAVKTIRASGIEFDGFIGTGTSGALVVPVLATLMDKHVVLVRKSDDRSAHSSYPIVGDRFLTDARLIFADDLIDTGNTLRYVNKVMTERMSNCQIVATFEANKMKVYPVENNRLVGRGHISLIED